MSTNENNKPSWSDAPQWAEWLARDRSGAWHWFETQPETTTADTWETSFGNCRPVLDVIAWERLIEHRHDARDRSASDEPADDGELSGAALHRVCAELFDRHGAGWVDYIEWFSDSHGTWQTAPNEEQLYLAFARNEPIRRRPRTCHLIDANGAVYEIPMDVAENYMVEK